MLYERNTKRMNGLRRAAVCLALALAAVLPAAAGGRIHERTISVVPCPETLIRRPGRCLLSERTSLLLSDRSLEPVAGYFTEKIARSSGIDLKERREAGNTLALRLDTQRGIPEEGYELTVAPDGIELVASTGAGIFYGMQTLMQLLPAGIESPTPVPGMELSIPCVEIRDAPRMAYRGVMLDACRHFSTVEEIEKLLDVMAMYKLNKFHWHLTDDQLWTVEIRKYPRLTKLGGVRTETDGTIHRGFYTQRDIRRIVAYAAARQIDVIPEIEMPGHAMAAITAYPELSCRGGSYRVRNLWGVEQDVYCAGRERTFRFIEEVLSEIVELFPYEYVHVGGDECPKERWKECPLCQARMKQEGLKTEFELQSYFIRRVEKILQAKGRKLIGWDEILEGSLSPTATVMSWRGEEGGIAAANHGNQVIMTPIGYMYMNMYQGAMESDRLAYGWNIPLGQVYGYDPYPAQILPEKRHLIWGVQANMWTEYAYGPEDVEYQLFPRTLALAELAWSLPANKDFGRFSRSLENQHVRLDLHGINYHIPMPEGVACSDVRFLDSITLRLTNTRDYPMVYTLDGSAPTASSEVLNGPLTLDEECVVRVATLLPTGRLSPERRFTVSRTQLAPSADVETEPGIVRTLACGDFRRLGDLGAAQWGAPEVLPDFAFPFEGEQAGGAAIFTGYIDIPESGVYVFGTDADRLEIDSEEVVNNDGKLAMHQLGRGTRALEKGRHAFRMTFLNYPDGGRPRAWDRLGFVYKLQSDKEFVWAAPESMSH